MGSSIFYCGLSRVDHFSVLVVWNYLVEVRKYLIEKDAGGWHIVCLTCKKKSYHLRDISERYCAWCKRFHDEIAQA